MEVIKRKSGTRYKEKVYLPDGSTETKTFSRKTDATQWQTKRQLEIEQEVAIGIAKRRNIKFSEVVAEWLDRKIKPFKRERTLKNYVSDVSVHITPLVESLNVSDITRMHADKLVQKMKSLNYSPRTINKALERFKQILNFALDEEYINRNPLARYQTLPEYLKKDVYLTQGEIKQLLRGNLLSPLYPALVFALNTGLRLGEIAGLCWDRVNFETNQVEITRTLSREGLSDTTKSHRVRYVPLNLEARRILENLIKLQLHTQFVFVVKRTELAQYESLDVNHISQRGFKECLRRAGINRHVRFHDMRHTFASHFMMNGGNIYDLQKILGHQQLETTLRYAHLSPQHLSQAILKVNFGVENSEKIEANSPYLALKNF